EKGGLFDGPEINAFALKEQQPARKLAFLKHGFRVLKKVLGIQIHYGCDEIEKREPARIAAVVGKYLCRDLAPLKNASREVGQKRNQMQIRRGRRGGRCRHRRPARL